MKTGMEFSYMDERALLLMKVRVFDLLEKRGAEMNHPQVLKLLDRAGARVDFDTNMVRFPKRFLEEQIEHAPSYFSLCGRDGKHRLEFPHPENTFHTRTGTGAQSWVESGTGKYRPIELNDIASWGRLVSKLDHISFCTYAVPSDAPPETCDIYALRTLLQNTEKHIWIQPYTGETVEYLMKMVTAAAGGESKLRDNPLASWITCSMTPLKFKYMDLEIIQQAANYGMPLQSCSLPTSGATGPYTAPGSVLLAAAEELVMIATAQVIAPGIPIISTSLQFSADMRTGMSLQSSVESMRQSALFVQFMSKGFGLPTHTYGSGTDSPDIDAQSMTERAMRTMMMAMSGASVLGGAGQLETACTISPVQLVIDNEVFGMAKAMISEMTFNDDAMAWDELMNCKPGDQFLTNPHTFKHCRDSFEPINFTRLTRDAWELKGGHDLRYRANRDLKTIMKNAGSVIISDDIKKEMEDIIKSADTHLR
ncbi:MAG: trimethylamine methyltransferase family protein [Desulfobacterales bacterium]|nr:trimethylamine methyltransferase family protein [Desulfobacterales bacterium]